MPDQSSRTASHDFALPSTDQSYANQLGVAESAPHAGHEGYGLDQATNVAGGATASDRVAAQDHSVKYAEYSVQQSSVTPHAASAQYAGYSFSPGGQLVWDWENPIDFPDFANHYEPQGELVHELQNSTAPTNDFSIPLPVTDAAAIQQSLQQRDSSHSATVQNPLSPPPRPTQKPSIQTGVKRKAESEPSSAVSQTASNIGEALLHQPKRANKSRSSSSASVSTSPVAATAAATDSARPPMTEVIAAMAATDSQPPAASNTNNDPQKRKEPSKGTGPQGRVIDVSKPRRIVESPSGTEMLPAGKVFPIQIGSELFRLSGASISSDAPSYFSHFFGEQLHSNGGRPPGDLRTLYIDRDPDTFRDIALHLQGYHITPRDGEHFVRLYADAQFYSLPRLTKQLFSTDIFIRIGGVPFQIPRDLFSAPGDSPNYFSLGFAQFFSTPTEVFPGLDRNALLRPPSIRAPTVPNRNGETFAELVKMLQGYTVDIRNDAHRSQLLRDARYFHLRALEQKLIPCELSFNLRRNQSEILIRLEDIRQSGISFTPDGSIPSSSSGGSTAPSTSLSPAPPSKPASPAPPLGGPQFRPGTVTYARPYTDDHANTNILILEVSSSESTTLHLPLEAPKPSTGTESLMLNLRATFHGSTLARITSLFSVIASKMGLPATQPLGLMMLQSGGGVAAQPVSPANSGVSERRVCVQLSSDCYIDVDNVPAELSVDSGSGRLGIRHIRPEPQPKRRALDHTYEADAASVASKSEWVWGGAREVEVQLGPDIEEQEEELVVKRAHWRLRVEPVPGERGKMQVVLCGVRIEGYSGERSRNQSRGFLGRV